MVSFCRESGGRLTIDIRVQPRAGRTGVVAANGDHLRVKLAAPPVDGAANEELVRYVAELLGVPRGRVSLRLGERSKRKVVAVEGATEADLMTALARLGIPGVK